MDLPVDQMIKVQQVLLQRSKQTPRHQRLPLRLALTPQLLVALLLQQLTNVNE